MPFRHVPRLAACPRRLVGSGSFSSLPNWRPFHSSRAHLQDDVDGASRSHYETLNVAVDASHAEIKKSFYRLSKSHHPDHNPADPGAPGRFMRLSAAYAVLSSPEKRAAYDHQHGHHHTHRHPAHHHKGSYSSTGPAGGRPASGLSRRRGTFTGPPPSFYRNGGWGQHGAKRAAAHEESTGESGSSGGSSAADGAGGASAGGMGPGDGRRSEDVPHFDRVSHERTHRRMERRRRAAQEGRAAWMRGEAESGFLAKFIFVSAAVVLAVLAPVIIFARWEHKALHGDGRKNAKNE